MTMRTPIMHEILKQICSKLVLLDVGDKNNHTNNTILYEVVEVTDGGYVVEGGWEINTLLRCPVYVFGSKSYVPVEEVKEMYFT